MVTYIRIFQVCYYDIINVPLSNIGHLEVRSGNKNKEKNHLYKRNVSCNEKIENDNKTKKGIADVYVIAK